MAKKKTIFVYGCSPAPKNWHETSQILQAMTPKLRKPVNKKKNHASSN